jgi:hypothetical protein
MKRLSVPLALAGLAAICSGSLALSAAGVGALLVVYRVER